MSEGFNMPKATATSAVFASFKGESANLQTRFGEYYKGKSL